MIVFADLHLRERSEDVCFRVLEAVERLALEDDHHVVCCGDFWHIRYQLNVRLLNRVAELMRRWDELGIRVDFVPGNHDQVDVDGRNALEVFEGPGCYIWTEPGAYADGRCGFVPYRKDPAQQFEDLVAVSRKVLPDGIIFGHLAIDGAVMNNGRKCQEGLRLSSSMGISPWLVLGHYHERQSGQGWSYVGSPYQTDFGEAGNVCGVLRLGSGEPEWLPLGVGAPTHHVLKWDPAKDEQPPPRPTAPNAKVRLDIEASHEMIVSGKFKAALKTAGLDDVEVQVVPVKVERQERFEMRRGETLLEAAERFAVERLDPNEGGDAETAMEALRRWAE